MIAEIKKFFKLPGEEQGWFLEAWLLLGLMRAAILFVPFRKLTGALRQLKGGEEFPVLGRPEQELAIRVGRTIARAASHTPWQSACLVQSLTAKRMLARRGVPGVIFLGVAREDNSIEKMKAHSWTRCGEVVITGRAGHEGFTVVGSFLWEARR